MTERKTPESIADQENKLLVVIERKITHEALDPVKLVSVDVLEQRSKTMYSPPRNRGIIIAIGKRERRGKL